MYQKRSYLLTGECPLLMHSGQMADPRNPLTLALKKVSGKRAKTDADFEEMARLEWLGSLYVDQEQIVIPSEVMEAALIGAAKKKKRGPAMKSGAFCDANFPLHYAGLNGGKLDLDAMWASGDYRHSTGVRVQQSRVVRTRPIFRDWSVEVTISFNPELLDGQELDEIIVICGEQIGLLDWRPKYGRFTSKQV